MKKAFSIVLSVLCILLAVSCGGNKEAETSDAAPQATSEKAAAPAKGAKQVVRVLLPGISDQKTVDPISGLVTLGKGEFEKFIEERVPYDIEIVSIPWQGWIQKTEALVTAGEVDVGFFTNQEAVPNWYADLTPYLEKDPDVNFDNFNDIFIEPVLNYTLYKSFNHPEATNKVYGLPLTMACNFLIYDTQLFDDWGVPYPTEDLEFHDFVEIAKKMTGKNPKTGFDNYGSYALQFWAEWYALAYDAVKVYKDVEGGSMLASDIDMDEFVEYIKDSPEVLQFFTDYAELVSCSPAGVATRDGAERFLTADNDIGLMLDSSAFDHTYVKYLYSNNTAITDRFQPLMIPEGPKSNMAGFPEFFRLAVAAGAKDKDAAWEVVKAMTTNKEIVDFFLLNYESGKLPALKNTDGMKVMDLELNQQRHAYQMEHMLITDDYWNWRTPMLKVNTDLVSGVITPEEARQALYEGVKTWVNNIKEQLGQN